MTDTAAGKDNKPKKTIVMPGSKTKSGGKEPKSPQASNQSNTRTPGGAVTGAGMDRKIEVKKNPLKTYGVPAAAVVALLFVGYMFLGGPGGRSLKVTSDRISISEVTSGVFEDFIPVRGRVEPLKTVYLDAVQGGRVEEILVEDGTMLRAGQPLVRLSNSDLQLNVMGNESRVMEQLNQMRDQELRLEQNRLGHKRNLIELNYRIGVLERDIRRQEELVAQGFTAARDFDEKKQELEYLRQRRDITMESQESDERMMVSQLAFFRDKSEQLEDNLNFARKSLDDLNVKAPTSGKLSGFDLEIGQSISRGERIGQIDDPDRFKLTALIDEFYLGRVGIGQVAVYEGYELAISKIYPDVENGQFEVDMQFAEGTMPTDIRRGQTIQTKLTLGDSSEAVLIPNGAFFQDTGGNWIFVVTADGTEAVKRNVRMGRRNTRYIEVLEGLEVGERVVTSPYTSFRDMDRLKLN
ncbi:efflux RND transporter periplasmic adaptor subunit [Kordiimonas sediminis]|nr:HlyD family efflux transporter periplasmic adaptor subunit [Kordiimonas sediminis]